MSEPTTERASRHGAVMPAHNEAARVARVIKETLTYVSRVIVGDEGSSDATAELARQGALCGLVSHPAPQGYLRALATGSGRHYRPGGANAGRRRGARPSGYF